MSLSDWSQTSIVAVEAHQDDVELAAMGTLVKLARAGARITICCVTDGGTGTADRPELTPAQVTAIRCAEATASAERIDARFVCLGAPDSFLYDDPQLRVAIVDVLRAARADIVLTCPPNDYHDDHTRAGALALQAAHLATVPQVRTEHAALPAAPAVYYFDSVTGLGFDPDFFIDISEVIEEKRAHARCHASQMSGQAAIMGWDLVTNIDALARMRGLQSGVGYAEAFASCRRHPRMKAWRHFPR